MRSNVEEAEGGAKDGLGKTLVELARCFDGAENEREVHSGEGDGRSQLDAGVDGEVKGGARIPVAGVDPSTDPPALRKTGKRAAERSEARKLTWESIKTCAVRLTAAYPSQNAHPPIAEK